ncbi:hypothetical protein INT47_007994 [Mucor saturninus]|uniref:RING-type domain-containing protein n=1 Tax=Mucor saturninus TaxID=64648 RepID=A0A8H7R7J8_9FUNG|nr:hypothetical protein INT47_007994 [Mucor saturninus]
MYSRHLVRIDLLEKAYSHLLINQQNKSYWKLMDPFIQIWYTELDRVCQQSQIALANLKHQLDDLSTILCAISSPLKNRDRESLRKTQQFINTCLNEWDLHPSRTTSTINNYTSKSMIVGSCFSDNTLFSETTLLHENNSEIQDSRFKIYCQGLDSRFQKEIESNKSNPRLRQCIRQVYSLEQDLYLYHHYITSQFSILWDLGSISLSSLPEVEEPSLYQVMKMRWDQRYNMQLQPYQLLETKFKSILKSSTPDIEDFTCAVCLSILHEPTTLETCHHTFCRSCVQHLYCGHCHRHRAKTMNRISENLLLLLKPTPAVYCTCQTIDSITGELSLKNQHESACPLCRTAFKPGQCNIDVELEKFISLYFPKRKHDDDDQLYDEEEKKKKKDRRKKKSADRGASTSDDINRRRSQISAGKFYTKMQRWSNRWAQNDAISSSAAEEDEISPVPLPPSVPLENDMFLLARRSWMF